MNLTQSTGGFWYSSSCHFEGELNRAEHSYKNLYGFTDSDIPLLLGMLNFAGNANATVKNITIEVFQTFSALASTLGYVNNPTCIPQDDELQTYVVDQIYTTMPENPSGERTGLIGILTPNGSTRKYQYNITNALFDERFNDAEIYFAIVGLFTEDAYISNMTFANSEIAFQGIALYTMTSLTIDGIISQSNKLNGNFIIYITS